MFQTWPVKISKIDPSSTPSWRLGISDTIATIIVMVAQWRDRGDNLDELEREYLAELVRSGAEQELPESTIELKAAQGARAIQACREFLA